MTVMVPSYNYAQYLEECVTSAATQQGVDVDVAIVDNGSTDGSPEIGQALAQRYDNVRYRRYDDNQGIIASLNRCRQEVRGEYAVLLCADDCLTPGSIGRSVSLMDAHPDVGLVYGRATDFTRLADVRPEQLEGDVRPPIVHTGGTWVDRLCRSGNNPIRTPEALMRSSVLDVVGGYEPACPYTSDLNLWLRIAAASDVGYLRGPSQALFRMHDTNYGGAYPHFSVQEVRQRWMAYEKFFAALDGDPRRTKWERMARRNAGSEARYAATRSFVSTSLDTPEDEQLLLLADEIDPGRTSSIERAGWALRRRLGPKQSRWFPGFIPRPALRRMQGTIDERRRLARGIA